MKQSLIDTDILSEFFRGNQAVIDKFNIYLNKFDSINFSIITYYEILNGLLYKDAKKQLNKFEKFAEINNIIPLTLESVKVSAKIQADLKNAGSEIGHTNTLIAGIAIVNGFQLITNNTNHFKRIKKIDIENWTR